MTLKKAQAVEPRKPDSFGDALAEQVASIIVERLEARSGGGGSVRRLAGNAEEFGFAFGMSGDKVRELIRRGLPHIKIGAQTRILFESPEVLSWLREHGDYLGSGE